MLFVIIDWHVKDQTEENEYNNTTYPWLPLLKL